MWEKHKEKVIEIQTGYENFEGSWWPPKFWFGGSRVYSEGSLTLDPCYFVPSAMVNNLLTESPFNKAFEQFDDLLWPSSSITNGLIYEIKSSIVKWFGFFFRKSDNSKTALLWGIYTLCEKFL